MALLRSYPVGQKKKKKKKNARLVGLEVAKGGFGFLFGRLLCEV